MLEGLSIFHINFNTKKSYLNSKFYDEDKRTGNFVNLSVLLLIIKEPIINFIF